MFFSYVIKTVHICILRACAAMCMWYQSKTKWLHRLSSFNLQSGGISPKSTHIRSILLVCLCIHRGCHRSYHFTVIQNVGCFPFSLVYFDILKSDCHVKTLLVNAISVVIVHVLQWQRNTVIPNLNLKGCQSSILTTVIWQAFFKRLFCHVSDWVRINTITWHTKN